MSKQAIVTKQTRDGYQAYAISIDGVCGYCLNANTIWQDDFEDSDWEQYKRIVDNGEPVTATEDVAPLDMRDEIVRAGAELVVENY